MPKGFNFFDVGGGGGGGEVVMGQLVYAYDMLNVASKPLKYRILQVITE